MSLSVCVCVLSHILSLSPPSWVGHEKEGFRGYQYLLEEGEYHDWRVWGGHNAELRSIRVLRAVSDHAMDCTITKPPCH